MPRLRGRIILPEDRLDASRRGQSPKAHSEDPELDKQVCSQSTYGSWFGRSLSAVLFGSMRAGQDYFDVARGCGQPIRAAAVRTVTHTAMALCTRHLVVLLTIVVSGCSDGNKSGSRDNATATPVSNTRIFSQQVSAEPTTADSPEADKPGIQLEEILYLPEAGDVAYIELANVSDELVPLKFLTLQVDESLIPLERAAESLAAGARLLVLFDGPARAEGLKYHVGNVASILADGGRAAILDRFGVPIDEIAWGEAPGAVSPVAGGMWFEVELGTSIGRAPGTAGQRGPLAWVGYPPAEVTPGAENLPPAVRSLHPLSGASTGHASFSWFPVPGVKIYQLQIAMDEAFAKPLVDQSTPRPRFVASTLAPGRYLWRVRAHFEGEKASAWSPVSMLRLIEGATLERVATIGRATALLARFQQWATEVFLPVGAEAQPASSIIAACPPSASQPGQESCKILAVPFIRQHKDTQMLLLEQNVPAGPHAWDVDHGDLDEDDPADNANCALASLAMINRFAGGNLSQDRIGYEIRKAWAPGPELDVMYARGVGPDHMLVAYQFALGTAANYQPAQGLGDLWNNVTNQLRNGNPVLAGPPGHVLVIIGFRIVNGHRLLVVNDPWETSSQEYDIDDPYGRNALVRWRHWLPTGDFVAKQQEPTVRLDSDGDGVVDFDESERFHTKPDSNDSDNDGVGDKQDIYASVFDRRYGYAKFGTGRDEDRDGKPMELDPDSDAGGCRDGQEDQNANGKHDTLSPANAETWNFKFVDDSCQDLVGHLTYRVHSAVTIVPDVQFGDTASTTSISVRLKPVPGETGIYEDDGSRFHYTGSHQVRTVAPECQMIGQSWASASGDFTGTDAGLVQGVITDDGKLNVHFTAGIPNEHTGGWASICGVEQSGRAGDSHSAEFRDECWGDPIKPGERGYVLGHKTFNFSCHERDWSASGIVTVP